MKDINLYFKDVKRAFPVFSKKEKQYMENFRHCVLDYIEANDGIDIHAIIDEFGTPAEVVSEYLAHVDNEYLINSVQRSYYIKRVIVFLVTVLFVSICYRSYSLDKLLKKAEEQIATVEETIIIEE